MANRYSKMVRLDGDLLRDEIKAKAGGIQLFAGSIGVSDTTVHKALNGVEVSTRIEDAITRGLFRPEGYFRMKETVPKKDGEGSTENTDKILITISKQTYEGMKDQEALLEDIKASNELILSAIKTQTTLLARLLAIWEGKGEKNA